MFGLETSHWMEHGMMAEVNAAFIIPLVGLGQCTLSSIRFKSHQDAIPHRWPAGTYVDMD